MTLFVAILFGFIFTIWANSQVEGVCCHNNCGRCNDCEEPGSGNIYCGHKAGGGCNIFGCNCQFGCRGTEDMDSWLCPVGERRSYWSYNRRSIHRSQYLSGVITEGTPHCNFGLYCEIRLDEPKRIYRNYGRSDRYKISYWDYYDACKFFRSNNRKKRSLAVEYNDIAELGFGNNLYYGGNGNVSKVFAQADVNLDGKLSYDEAEAYLVTLGLGFQPQTIKKEIEKMDVNKDKYLSENEIDA